MPTPGTRAPRSSAARSTSDVLCGVQGVVPLGDERIAHLHEAIGRARLRLLRRRSRRTALAGRGGPGRGPWRGWRSTTTPSPWNGWRSVARAGAPPRTSAAPSPSRTRPALRRLAAAGRLTEGGYIGQQRMSLEPDDVGPVLRRATDAAVRATGPRRRTPEPGRRTRGWSGWRTGWWPGSSTTGARRPGSMATCGRATLFDGRRGADRPGRARRPRADRPRHAAPVRRTSAGSHHQRVRRGRRPARGLGRPDRAAPACIRCWCTR